MGAQEPRTSQAHGHSHGHSHGHGHGHSHGQDHARVPVLKPFRASTQHPISRFQRAAKLVMRDGLAVRLAAFGAVELAVACGLYYLALSSGSFALRAVTCRLVSDVLCLLGYHVAVWSEQQQPSAAFSFGCSRVESLYQFSAAALSILLGLFMMKEGLEEMLDGDGEIDGSYLLVAGALACTVNMGGMYLVEQHGRTFSAADAGLNAGGVSSRQLRRGAAWVCYGCFTVAVVLLHWSAEYAFVDGMAGIVVLLSVLLPVVPVAQSNALVLMQTASASTLAQLDKCLREVSTFDGVLEFHSEHFWTVSPGKLAGSLVVRVRRDADEQAVLAHITHKLSRFITPGSLTVQITKEDRRAMPRSP